MMDLGMYQRKMKKLLREISLVYNNKKDKFITKDFSQMSRITIHSELIVNKIMKMMILTTTKGIKDMT